MKRFLPWLALVLCGLWLLAELRLRPELDFHYRQFGRLPVLLNGRVQPLDSVGRNALRQLRNRQSVPLEGRAQLTATPWLMEVTMDPEAADQRKVFRIDNDEVKALLQLPGDEKHFSFAQIRPHYEALTAEAERIGKIEPPRRTVFETQAYKLYNATIVYQRLRLTLKPPGVDDFAAVLNEFLGLRETGAAAVRAQQEGRAYDTNAFQAIVGHLARFNQAARFGYALVVPPADPARNPGGWQNLGTALMETIHGGAVHPAVTNFAAMVSAYRQKNPEAFNHALTTYREWLAVHLPAEVKKGREEFWFNFLDPFYKATVLYTLALLLALAFWFTWAPWLRRSAFHLVALAFALHTIGLVLRMYLERRPPVTNLYSSAVFIGWGSVILGMFLERVFRDGIGSVVAALVGLITQIIAMNLALGGDTMEMMRAVLDSNFWLATHVITITLGYSAMFVAGLLAILFIVRGLFTTTVRPETAATLNHMVYGVICFATFFSFIGTVLGGIWADQSWGRFWGWDPKENGALLIVLWCAVILHARWDGMIRERGLMNMAIVGNIITAWSWFGTNMLGVGLHSYGFMDAAFKWLLLFVASQLALIGLGMLPLRWWASFRANGALPLSTAASGK